MTTQSSSRNLPQRALPGLLVLLALPLLGASPAPTASSSAGAPTPPPVDVMSASLFVGTSPAPPPEAWKTAKTLSGVRMGRGAIDNGCVVEHVLEWVRVRCEKLTTGRVDLVAGEKRDFSIAVADHSGGMFGENMLAVFSMRSGDRRVVQWLAPDEWEDVWWGDEGLMASGVRVVGPMFGAALQVDWSGPEPKMSLF
jgi:hypothetical protein